MSSIFKNFTVDAGLLRELGERLVGRPEVALAELVKNGYDADASEVVISFSDDSIAVSDNGSGMSEEEFEKFWLRVGTTHKQIDRLSDSGRELTGSKGVGRLAVQFLGTGVELISRKIGEAGFRASVDWEEAVSSGDLVSAKAELYPGAAGESIAGRYSHGTLVRVTGLKRSWDSELLKNLARELWFLQPPEVHGHGVPIKNGLRVILEGVSDKEYGEFDAQMRSALDNWIAVISGTLEHGVDGEEVEICVEFQDGQRFKQKFAPSAKFLDKALYRIYVYKLSHRQKSGVKVKTARDYFREFGGVHIYDGGFRLPFYGGGDQDWLRLEYDHSHRLNKSQLLPAELQVSSGLNDLPTNGRIFGWVQISTAHERIRAEVEASDGDSRVASGEYLNVQVTRDRLIDNQAFSVLRDIVRWGIDFYAMRSYERKQIRIAQEKLEIPVTTKERSKIREMLFQLSLKSPTKLHDEIEAVTEQFERLESLELTRQKAINSERILLAALATSGMAAIAMEHELGKELTVLENIVAKLDAGVPVSAPEMRSAVINWSNRTGRARKLFSPVMTAHDREEYKPYKAWRVISQIVDNSEALLREVEVDVSGVPKNMILPNATVAAWNAVFQNVIINAVNAMINSDRRSIFCEGLVDGKKHFIHVMDTGVGVSLLDSDELFKPFVRRLEIPEERKALGLGGMGMGLTIVKMVADSIGCGVSFVEPRLGYKTSFRIEWTVE